MSTLHEIGSKETHPSMVFEIYSDSMQSIKMCKAELTRMLEKGYVEKTVTDYRDILKTLSKKEVLQF